MRRIIRPNEKIGELDFTVSKGDAANRHRQLTIGFRRRQFFRRHAGRLHRRTGRDDFRCGRLRRKELLQVERPVGIDDETRVKAIHCNTAERQLERIRGRIDSSERERLPAHQLLRRRPVERAEIADRDVARIARAHCAGTGLSVRKTPLCAERAAGHDDVRAGLEIRSQRHEVEAIRVDAQIAGERIGCERAGQTNSTAGAHARGDIDSALYVARIAEIVGGDFCVGNRQLDRRLGNSIFELRRKAIERQPVNQQLPAGVVCAAGAVARAFYLRSGLT